MRNVFLFSMFLLTTFTSVIAQNRTVKGTIRDAGGALLQGATIYASGSSAATTSDSLGAFSLNVSPSAKQLVVTYVGFASQTVALKGQTNLSIQLESSDPNLNEVVVVAYGTSKKEALTGSVGQIKADAFKTRPINNISSAVEGAIPGVAVMSANGQPGSSTTIRVRGFGSINASSDPLIILDGATYLGSLSNISPDDIESINVLKDAASTALYGSRAANGVVVITSKKGKKGRNNVSARLMQGVSSRGLPEYDRVSPFEYYPLMWEAYRNALVYPITGTGISRDSASRVASGLTSRDGIKNLLGYNPFNVPANAIVSPDGKINPNASLIYGDDLDWTKELMRTGSRKDYSVNFSGGAEKSDYFFSAGYVKEDGYTQKSDFERFSSRLNVNVQPKDWLKAGLNISGNYSEANQAADGGALGTTNFVNPFFFARNIGSIYPVYLHNMTTGDYVLDPFGNKIWDLGNYGTSPIGIANGIASRPSGGFGGRMALAETLLNDDVLRRTVVSARNNVDLLFTKNLKFTNNIAIDFQNSANSTFQNTLVGDGAPGGRASRNATSVTGLTLNQLLNYNRQFGNQTLDLLFGHESFNRRSTSLSSQKQGQSLSGNSELGNFTTINSATSQVDNTRIESYFARVNYDLNSKYYVSGSVRRDGNSQFSSKSRWGTFWSVGAGWNILKEDFMTGVEWISALKLRSSYGGVGNADGIGTYAYQALYSYANIGNEPGIAQTQDAFENLDLTWENNRQFDVAVDFSMFKDRLNGTIEYFNRGTSDLLFAVPVALSTGALSFNKNTADMNNRGFELNLNGNIIESKNFIWNANLNLTTFKNEITRMPPDQEEILTSNKKYSVGHSIYDFWLRTYYGVDPTDGSALYVSANPGTAAGRRIIANKNGGMDTVSTLVANAKFEYQGSSIPDLTGSFTQSFTYKQFTLSALLVFQLGGKINDGLYSSIMTGANYGGAIHKDMLNAWHQPGDITNIPRLDAGRATDFYAASSRWLIDASYINIRTLNLSYNLPKSIASRLTLSNAQVFGSVENAGFFSRRKGMNNQQTFAGNTTNAYPPARVITAGISVTL